VSEKWEDEFDSNYIQVASRIDFDKLNSFETYRSIDGRGIKEFIKEKLAEAMREAVREYDRKVFYVSCDWFKMPEANQLHVITQQRKQAMQKFGINGDEKENEG
jgi:hypothetical protein